MHKLKIHGARIDFYRRFDVLFEGRSSHQDRETYR